MGRPTVMTPESLDKLRQAFLIGASDSEACAYAKIGQSTLYEYQKEHPDFTEQKDQWKQEPILKAKFELVKGLDGNPELSLKYLERKKKDEFSLRSEFTGKDGSDLAGVSFIKEE